MSRTLFIILVVCALSAMAAVPKRMRLQRAINPDEEENKTPSSTSATTIICAPQTPCGWLVYGANKLIIQNITNTYCKCAEGTECMQSEDDKIASAFVLTCKKPVS